MVKMSACYPALKCNRKSEMHLNPADELFTEGTQIKYKNHLKI